MQRTNIYLEDAQTSRLDRLAQEEGVSRAELIRRFIDAGLDAGSASLDDDVRAIRESAGVLADLAAPRRDRDGRRAHLDRQWGDAA